VAPGSLHFGGRSDGSVGSALHRSRFLPTLLCRMCLFPWHQCGIMRAESQASCGGGRWRRRCWPSCRIRSHRCRCRRHARSVSPRGWIWSRSPARVGRCGCTGWCRPAGPRVTRPAVGWRRPTWLRPRRPASGRSPKRSGSTRPRCGAGGASLTVPGWSGSSMRSGAPEVPGRSPISSPARSWRCTRRAAPDVRSPGRSGSMSPACATCWPHDEPSGSRGLPHPRPSTCQARPTRRTRRASPTTARRRRRGWRAA